MPAEFTSTGKNKGRGWCEKCQDGINASAYTASVWVITHNKEHHKEKS